MEIKITEEKTEIIFKNNSSIYYNVFNCFYLLGFHKKNFNFEIKRSMKIKTYFNTYSFGYKMSYEDFKEINNVIEEKVKEYKNSIKS